VVVFRSLWLEGMSGQKYTNTAGIGSRPFIHLHRDVGRWRRVLVHKTI
jgi:hypothetical protein